MTSDIKVIYPINGRLGDNVVFDTVSDILTEMGVSAVSENNTYRMERGGTQIGYLYRGPRFYLTVHLFNPEDDNVRAALIEGLKEKAIYEKPSTSEPTDTDILVYSKGDCKGTLEETGLSPGEIARLTYNTGRKQ